MTRVSPRSSSITARRRAVFDAASLVRWAEEPGLGALEQPQQRGEMDRLMRRGVARDRVSDMEQAAEPRIGDARHGVRHVTGQPVEDARMRRRGRDIAGRRTVARRRSGQVEERFGAVDDGLDRHHEVVPGRRHGAARAGPVGTGWEPQRPDGPLTVDALEVGRLVLGCEGLVHRGERRAGRPTQLVVAGPQRPEGVVVAAEPDVEAVLLDAPVGGWVPAARALAAEPPTHLIHGDVVTRRPIGCAGELQRGGQGGHASAQDRDPAHVGHPVRAPPESAGPRRGTVRRSVAHSEYPRADVGGVLRPVRPGDPDRATGPRRDRGGRARRMADVRSRPGHRHHRLHGPDRATGRARTRRVRRRWPES